MALTESGKIYTERGAENDKQLEKRNENEASSWLYTVGISQHSKGAGSLNAVSVREAGRTVDSLGTDK